MAAMKRGRCWEGEGAGALGMGGGAGAPPAAGSAGSLSHLPVPTPGVMGPWVVPLVPPGAPYSYPHVAPPIAAVGPSGACGVGQGSLWPAAPSLPSFAPSSSFASTLPGGGPFLLPGQVRWNVPMREYVCAYMMERIIHCMVACLCMYV